MLAHSPQGPCRCRPKLEHQALLGQAALKLPACFVVTATSPRLRPITQTAHVHHLQKTQTQHHSLGPAPVSLQTSAANASQREVVGKRPAEDLCLKTYAAVPCAIWKSHWYTTGVQPRPLQHNSNSGRQAQSMNEHTCVEYDSEQRSSPLCLVNCFYWCQIGCPKPAGSHWLPRSLWRDQGPREGPGSLRGVPDPGKVT